MFNVLSGGTRCPQLGNLSIDLKTGCWLTWSDVSSHRLLVLRDVVEGCLQRLLVELERLLFVAQNLDNLRVDIGHLLGLRRVEAHVVDVGTRVVGDLLQALTLVEVLVHGLPHELNLAVQASQRGLSSCKNYILSDCKLR